MDLGSFMLFVTNQTKSSIPQVNSALSRNNVIHYIIRKAYLVTVYFVVPAVGQSLLFLQACSDSDSAERARDWLGLDCSLSIFGTDNRFLSS